MKELFYKIFMVTLAVLSPIIPLMIACGFLIVADTITGIMAARKRGETITSSEMRRSVSKMVVYQIAIVSGFALETWMMGSFVPVSKIAGGVIGMVEFKSILENTSTVAGQDIVKLVLEKLGSKNAKK